MKKMIMAFVLVFVLLCGTLVAFAGGADPSVTIVSPSHESTVYSDSLLVSIKVTEAKTYSITLYEEKEKLADGSLVPLNLESLADLDAQKLANVALGESETFVSSNNLSFYTKKVSDVKPGVYRVKIDSLNSAGQTDYTTNSYFIVKDKSEKPAEEIFAETQQTGLLKSLQTFLKNIFSN